MKVKDCMVKNVTYLAPENTVLDCAKKMNDNHIGTVVVCDSNKKILGIVTDRDIVLRSTAFNKRADLTSLDEIMTKNVYYCNENEEITNAQNIMAHEQIRRLPVVNNNNDIVGIISLKDLCVNNDLNNLSIGQTLDNICNCDKKNAE